MRGPDIEQDSLFSTLSPEARVPKDHPLRPNRTMVDAALRELEVLMLLANELSNKQIANRLCISPAIVKRYTANVYHKLGVSDRRKAVVKATALAIIHS